MYRSRRCAGLGAASLGGICAAGYLLSGGILFDCAGNRFHYAGLSLRRFLSRQVVSVGWGMRALYLGALLAAGVVSSATAQTSVGPVAITNIVNGVPVTVNATSWISVNSTGNELTVQARIFADLIDLQKKFASILDAFKPTANNCANKAADTQNSVVSFRNGSIVSVDDQLVMSVRGDVGVVSCVAGPQKTETVLKNKKLLFLKWKVPVKQVVRTVKTRNDGAQAFRGSMPMQLVKKDGAGVALKSVEPNIKLEGQEALMTSANTNLAKNHINQKVYAALQSAIDPANLKAALPKDLQKMNMTVVSARFRSYGGHAIAEINLAAASAPHTQ
ncbi:MAG: hypothetical protein WA645_00960 [Pseudolabrys sp.]